MHPLFCSLFLLSASYGQKYATFRPVPLSLLSPFFSHKLQSATRPNSTRFLQETGTHSIFRHPFSQIFLESNWNGRGRHRIRIILPLLLLRKCVEIKISHQKIVSLVLVRFSLKKRCRIDLNPCREGSRNGWH